MSTPQPPAPRSGRRLLGALLAGALATGGLALVAPAAHAATGTPISSGSISWGLKTSFRSYVTGIAHGSVTAASPATDNGTQTTFPLVGDTWSDSSGTAAGDGSVNFIGHDGVLDLTISDPAIVVDGAAATLVVDAIDSDDNSYTDLALADLDLSTAVTRSGSTISITDAPATLTASGAAIFSYNGHPMYPAGTVLDTVDATIQLQAPPVVTVSRTSIGTDETATVTVTGSGFLPGDAIATRPPLAGRSGGVYVAIGKFAETWQPSKGAASSTRKNAGVKWAVPAADLPTIGGTAAGGIELSPTGSFTAELTVSKAALDAITGLDASHVNYGVYTYPGGGAVNATWETYTPVTFYDRSASTLKLSTKTTTYGTAAKVSAKVGPSSATGTVTLTGAGDPITATVKKGVASITLPSGLAAGTHELVGTYSGDAVRAGATATVSLTVRKASTTTRITPRTGRFGTPTTVAVKVSRSADGQVRLTGAREEIIVDVVAGRATVTLPSSLTPGTRKLKGTYLPDANHKGSSDTARLTVKKAATSTSASVGTAPTSTAAGTVVVTIAGVPDHDVPTGKVTLRVSKGSKQYTTTGRLSEGTVTLDVRKLAVGTWKLAVRYGGDSRYADNGYRSVGTVVVAG